MHLLMMLIFPGYLSLNGLRGTIKVRIVFMLLEILFVKMEIEQRFICTEL